MGEDRGGREGHPQPGPWLAQLHRPSGRGPGGLAGAESDPCRLGGGGNKGKGRNRGREGEGQGEGGGQYLSDAKRDVAHVEAPGLSSHLAPDHRHRRWGHSQTIRGHGGKEGGGWNLTRSFKKRRKGQQVSGHPWTSAPQPSHPPAPGLGRTDGPAAEGGPPEASSPLHHGAAEGRKPELPGHRPHPLPKNGACLLRPQPSSHRAHLAWPCTAWG